MTTSAPRALLVALLAVAAVAEEPSLQPTGLLHAEYRVDRPLAPDGEAVLTAHLVNVCEAPLRLAIADLTYQAQFVTCGVPAAKDTSNLDHEVWGPDVAAPIVIDTDRLRISGVGEGGRLPTWPTRDGLVLLQDEGYARLITFTPGWVHADAVPAKTTGIIVTVPTPIDVALPKLEPTAVTPAKPVAFAEAKPLYAPSARLVPFVHASPPRDASPPPPPNADPSGLRLVIELPDEVVPDHDLAVTYLVGNAGAQTVWVRQNALVPALATWDLERKGKALAGIDGAALRGTLDLLPERAPLALNPGEYLSWRRVLLARSLPYKAHDVCDLTLRLDVPWFAASPQAGDQAKVASLTATAVVRVGR